MHPDSPTQPSRIPRTLVEFVDPSGVDNVLHKAKALYINGQPVTVESGTIRLDFGSKEVTRVTLTLLPDEVHFIRKDMP